MRIVRTPYTIHTAIDGSDSEEIRRMRVATDARLIPPQTWHGRQGQAGHEFVQWSDRNIACSSGAARGGRERPSRLSERSWPKPATAR
jgi:hypothetical protein